MAEGQDPMADWNGAWELDRRDNWGVWLDYLGVPPQAQEAATKAPDFHWYRVERDAITMEHRIPAQGVHLLYRRDLDGTWQSNPYVKPTSVLFKEGEEVSAREWSQQGAELVDSIKFEWIQEGVELRQTILSFGDKGKTMEMVRRLTSKNEMVFTVKVLGDDGEATVGPCYAYFKKTGSRGPSPIAYLRANGQPLDTAEQRVAALEQVFRLVSENIQAFSDAHAIDRVTPARFDGSARLLMGACKYYQSLVADWMSPQKIEDNTSDMLKAGVEADFYVYNEPKGTCLVIAPWNATVLLGLIPTLGMLASGNRVVIKPSEQTPTVSAVLRRLCEKYLRGLVWVEEGGKDETERLIDEGPDHLCFTGGEEVAKIVAARAARTLTPVTLELGGKSPVFIDKNLSDVMLDKAVLEILQTKKAFSGGFCMAHDYALVHTDIYDAFCSKLRAGIEAFGEGRNVPLINQRHYEKVKAMLAEAGGEALPPLEEPHVPDDAAMTLPVTAILAPKPGAGVLTSEIFGPLLPVMMTSSIEDAIATVNSTPTGKALIAYCYSEDSSTVDAFLAGISCGGVAVNAGPQRMLANLHVGVGGIGASGTGCSMWGKHALREFSNGKHVIRPRGGFAQSFYFGPPPQPAAPQGSAQGGDVAAKGQVQKAFGGGGADKPALEEVFTELISAEAFKGNFEKVVTSASKEDSKLMAVRSMLPFAKREVLMNPEVTAKKRAGILNGYRDFAEKKQVTWRSNAAALKDRGMDVWEAELQSIRNDVMHVPDYYDAHGVGTLHSYARGNCNWEAAFDATSAYLLVHMHHYPKMSPSDGFDQLHKDLSSAAAAHLPHGTGETESAPLRCVDVGCGVGLSAFALCKNLDSVGVRSEITAVDLSPHFITVARHLQWQMSQEASNVSDRIVFLHADGLNLAPAGITDGCLDLFCVSEVTHEMPAVVTRRLWREAARVLRPGGVVAYLDLNPSQIMRDNSVSNLVTRIAMMNEPYFDEYIELDMPQAMEAAGLEVVEQTWPAKETWATALDASLRIIVARKPAA